MPRKALLCKGGEECPGMVCLAETEKGELSLIEHHEGVEEPRVFPVSLSSLMDASLGAKTHFASGDGTCEILPTSKRVVIAISEPGGTRAYYFVPRDHFKRVVENFERPGNHAYAS